MLRRPSHRALAAWDELRKAFAKGSGHDADYLDPLDPEEDTRSLAVSITSDKPRAIYYFTKGGAAHQLIAQWKALPRDATVVVRPGVQPARYAAAVRREARRCRSRVRFVGDLDPQDLAIYLSLAFGDYTMRPHARSAVPIVHVGVNDAWLAAADKAFPRGYGGTSSSFDDWAAIAMSDVERRYLEVVEQLGPPLEQWVGPRCASVLRSGRKLEIDAFLNRPPDPSRYARTLSRLLARRT
jgi:hypothetical protein